MSEEKKDLFPPDQPQGAPPSYQPTVVYQPGYAPAQPQPGSAPLPPPDYLIHSILAILCCFWPLGVVALIKSVEARTAYAGGRYADAAAASKSSRTFLMLSVIVGVVITVCTLLFVGTIYGVVFGVLAANR